MTPPRSHRAEGFLFCSFIVFDQLVMRLIKMTRVAGSPSEPFHCLCVLEFPVPKTRLKKQEMFKIGIQHTTNEHTAKNYKT